MFIKQPNTCFIVPTTPPFILPLVISFAKLLTLGKLKWVYHVQDIHPEISFVGKNKTWVYKFLKALDTFFLKNSNHVITLSDEMKSALSARDNTIKNSISVVNNFTENFIKSDMESLDCINEDRSKEKIIYIFSGNVGKFQRVTELVTYFLDLKYFNDVLYILGDGEEIPKITTLLATHVNKDRVRLLGRKPYDEANQIAAKCDYGIVSLNPNITKYAYPSKFSAYLSMGLKVLAFVDKDSQISEEVERYDLGGVISTSDELKDFINNSIALTDSERVRINNVSIELFGKKLLISRNFQLLESIK